MNAAIFLDRDGVIIENVDSYVRSWSEVVFLPQSLEAVARLAKSAYQIVLVTNQSVVGRGIISLQSALAINDRLVEVIAAAGGRVDGVFICPHAPEDDCACRKPRPGLILQAAEQRNLDLSRSILVGDALTDLQAGQTAGIPTNVLVRSGRGSAQAARLPTGNRVPIYDHIGAVVDALLAGLLPGADAP